jgi:hypothetical protein
VNAGPLRLRPPRLRREQLALQRHVVQRRRHRPRDADHGGPAQILGHRVAADADHDGNLVAAMAADVFEAEDFSSLDSVRARGRISLRGEHPRRHRHAGRDRDSPPASALPAPFCRRRLRGGYYSYLWAEMLDADGFGAFTEAGDPFDPAVAGRLRTLLAAGDTRDPMELYVAFRERAPSTAALLRSRDLNA